MAVTELGKMTAAELDFELKRGSRFVVYQYCISVIVLTFRRPSKVHLIGPMEGRVAKGLPYVLLSFLAGWWGIPWGPIYTVQSLWVNLRGGKDITDAVLANLQKQAQAAAAANKRSVS